MSNKIKKLIECIIFVSLLAIVENLFLFKHYPEQFYHLLVTIACMFNGFVGMLIYFIRIKGKE